MLTVSLDEGGHFENIENVRGHMFIGGVIFESETKDDVSCELRRLQKFFQGVCWENGCQYPEDLHYNWGNGRVINGGTANKVKKALEEQLPDFLQGRGKWNLERPFGKYYLYSLVSNQEGIDAFLANGISNLLDDGVASNRYEHMAYRSIENILFYNTRLAQDEEVRLDLATRLIKPKSNPVLKDEVDELGHEHHHVYPDGFKVTDAAGFRAALASAIQNTARNNMQVDLNVKSIKYHANKHLLEYGFLHLADTICTIYGNTLKCERNLSRAVKELTARCDDMAGAGNSFIWIYDEIDQSYRKAIQYYDSKLYFESMLTLYNGVVNLSEFSANYSLWRRALEEMYVVKPDKKAVMHAIDEFYDFITSGTDPVKDLQISRYVHSHLERMCQQLDERDMALSLFQLNRIDIVRHNHEGNTMEALKAYEECMKYAYSVPLEEVLTLRNTKSVLLLDSFQEQAAVEHTLETLDLEKKLLGIKKAIFPGKEDEFITYGKILSQLGQCYAYNGQHEQAYKYFREAMKKFGFDARNRATTLSYYLHASIDAGDKKKYEQLAKEYFHTTGYMAQLKQMVESEDKAKEYALFVFLKAQYQFYREETTPELMDMVAELIPRLSHARRVDHPWEMIYKYMAFLYLQLGKTKRAKEYMAKTQKSFNAAVGILAEICQNNATEFAALQKKQAVPESKFRYMHR